jgi:Protein kinase domain/Galactose oxidase, central domain
VIVGGRDQRHHHSDIFVLEITKGGRKGVMHRHKTTSSSAFTGRSSHTCTYVEAKRKCYVFGGQGTRNKFKNDLFVIERSMDISKVTPSGKLPPKRSGHVAFASGVDLFVFGGTNAKNCLNDLWAFDTSSRRWREVTPSGRTPTPRRGHTATLLFDGRIAAFAGGCGSDGALISDFQLLDLEKMVWIRPRLKKKTENHAGMRFLHVAVPLAANEIGLIAGTRSQLVSNDVMTLRLGRLTVDTLARSQRQLVSSQRERTPFGYLVDRFAAAVEQHLDGNDLDVGELAHAQEQMHRVLARLNSLSPNTITGGELDLPALTSSEVSIGTVLTDASDSFAETTLLATRESQSQKLASDASGSFSANETSHSTDATPKLARIPSGAALIDFQPSPRTFWACEIAVRAGDEAAAASQIVSLFDGAVIGHISSRSETVLYSNSSGSLPTDQDATGAPKKLLAILSFGVDESQSRQVVCQRLERLRSAVPHRIVQLTSVGPADQERDQVSRNSSGASSSSRSSSSRAAASIARTSSASRLPATSQRQSRSSTRVLDVTQSAAKKDGSSGSEPSEKSDAVADLRARVDYDASEAGQYASIASRKEIQWKGLLGVGKYGSVYLAEHVSTGKRFAVKCLPQEVVSANEEAVARERETQEALEALHPYIAKMFASFDDEFYVYMVLEYCACGEVNLRISLFGVCGCHF